jgi:hypothetical protein
VAGPAGRKPLEIVHDFIIKLLRDNPEFHQSKLKSLGLHDMVLGLLYSNNSPARRYAIDYARAYATDLPVAELVNLVLNGTQEVQTFAVAVLEQRTPAAIGLPTLLKLLGAPTSASLAKAKLQQGFKPDDISAEQFVEVRSRRLDRTRERLERKCSTMELMQQGVQMPISSASSKPRLDVVLEILSGRQGRRARRLLPSGAGRPAVYPPFVRQRA